MTTIKLTADQIAQVLAENEQVTTKPVIPPVKPITKGAVSWRSFFGSALDFKESKQYHAGLYTEGKSIPEEGISIAIDVPDNPDLKAYMSFLSVESTSISTTREGALNQTVGDFESGETHIWGTGGSVRAGINYPHTQLPMQLTPGRYYFNIRNSRPMAGSNYLKLKCYVKVF